MRNICQDEEEKVGCSGKFCKEPKVVVSIAQYILAVKLKIEH